MIKSLFATKLAPVSDALEGFQRVTNTYDYIQMFNWLYAEQSQVLYNYSPIFPFSYLNRGQRKLFVKYDWATRTTIPVCQKSEHAPSYSIHVPKASVQEIIAVAERLSQFSSQPVKITDVTKEYAETFLLQAPGWAKVKTSDDVIYDTTWIVNLEGNELASIRNKIRKAASLRPRVERLSPGNKDDVIDILNRWKETQGRKHFRVTIGRDVRLVEEYSDRIDFSNHFAFVAYIDNAPVAMSYGCRSSKDAAWGMQITRKALIEDGKGNKLVGLNDFIMYQLIYTMNLHGILYINDSGFYGPGVKANKLKWSGGTFRTIPMFDLYKK